jgi:kynureninase
VPFSLAGLESANILGGGYKYCQLGEGNCALRLPKDCTLRPIATGWFSEFDALTEKHEPGRVAYGRGGHRFAGATYDPTSHYRAAAVFQFFHDQGLTPGILRALSQHQVGLLIDQFDQLDLDPAVIGRDREIPLSQIGGFLVLRSPSAGEISANLKNAGVMTDHRGTVLRLGPAPYLTDSQLIEAISRLGDVCNMFANGKRR